MGRGKGGVVIEMHRLLDVHYAIDGFDISRIS